MMKLEIPVIGILRGIDPVFFGEVMAAAFAGGLQAIEVTINTAGAEQIVSRCRSAVPPGKLLGMGTVRNLEEARAAVGAGAMFMVSPNLDARVIEYANRQGIPIIAGALTPTEVYVAWQAGADMVKVFPCGSLGGPRYIRELLGPFDRVPLVAVGGVTLDNLAEYFAAGARAVGVSSSLFGKEALRCRDIGQVGAQVKKFIEQCPPKG
ncbi:MAG: bifunctional 4-hydroxy-2-oxoglutarate aldolase/2-dehydro-3-deoxy-phosphogluconate aldolase [Desulfobulbaceae bacterium]